MEREDLLWRLYDHHQGVSRYHDERRSKITTLVLGLSAAALGLVKIGNTSSQEDAWIGLFLIVIGAVSYVISGRHSHRCQMHDRCADHYLQSLIREVGLSRDEPPESNTAPQYSSDFSWSIVNLLPILLGLMILARMIAVCGC